MEQPPARLPLSPSGCQIDQPKTNTSNCCKVDCVHPSYLGISKSVIHRFPFGLPLKRPKTATRSAPGAWAAPPTAHRSAVWLAARPLRCPRTRSPSRRCLGENAAFRYIFRHILLRLAWRSKEHTRSMGVLLKATASFNWFQSIGEGRPNGELPIVGKHPSGVRLWDRNVKASLDLFV